MPNWCDNTLVVTGYVQDILSFAERLKNGKWEKGNLLLLQTFVPMPEKYEGTVSGSDPITADDGLTWYDWQNKYWGVKWGDIDTEIVDKQPGKIWISFRTPWGPPVEGLQAISKMFPKLTFEVDWREESPSRGHFIIENGEMI